MEIFYRKDYIMKNQDRTYLFESEPIPKAVAALCVPTILSSLVMVFYNLADTFFVGMLGEPVQNAGVALAAPVLLAFNAVNNLFGVGTSSKMSRALGLKDYDTVRGSSAFGFYCSLFFSIIFALVCTVFKEPLLNMLGAQEMTRTATSDYMFWTVTCGAIPAILNVTLAYFVRAEGASLHASIGTMSGCLLNIVLDPIFILKLGMGAAGAGLATFVSNCIACLYFFVLIFIRRRSTYVCLNPRRLSFKKHIVKDIFVVGIPASIQNLLNVVGMTVLNNCIAAYDITAATAAVGISHRVSMVPVQIAFGLSQGIMPLISYNFASGNIKRMKNSLIYVVRISMVLIVVMAAVLFIFSGTAIRLFQNDPEVIDYGRHFLRGMSAALPFLCFDFIGVGVFQACGMGGKSLVFALLRKLVLEIPAIMILNGAIPLYGPAWAQFCAELILAAAAAIVLIRLFRRLEKKTKTTARQRCR